MWQDISSISLGSEPTDGSGQAGEHDSHPSKGGRGEGRKSHGGLYGDADPLYSTRRRSMTSNHLQALPIQTAFTDMSTARAITCAQKHTHAHAAELHAGGAEGMERQANEERSEWKWRNGGFEGDRLSGRRATDGKEREKRGLKKRVHTIKYS